MIKLFFSQTQVSSNKLFKTRLYTSNTGSAPLINFSCFYGSTTLVRTSNYTPFLKLPLSSSCPLFLFLRFWGVAIWTRNPILPLWGCHVRITDWLLATITKLKSSWCQPMFDWDSFVKNKALTFPKRFCLGDFFQVFQNSTFQMINLVKNEDSSEVKSSCKILCPRKTVTKVVAKSPNSTPNSISATSFIKLEFSSHGKSCRGRRNPPPLFSTHTQNIIHGIS